MTKEQLELRLKELEDQTLELVEQVATLTEENKALKAEAKVAYEVRDSAIHNEHTLRINASGLEDQVGRLTADNEGLKGTLNQLASMYDEVFTSFKDASALFSTIDRNTKNVLAIAEQKLNAFNNPPKEVSKK
jgi:DNA repair exonuclease SbcCD ATPase subunit